MNVNLKKDDGKITLKLKLEIIFEIIKAFWFLWLMIGVGIFISAELAFAILLSLAVLGPMYILFGMAHACLKNDGESE